jgi:tape measure domain-containing protein
MLGGEIKVVLSLDNNQFVVQTQKAGVTIQELQRAIDRTSRSTEALEKHFTGLGGRFRSVVQTASMLRYALHDVHDIFMALPGAILKTSGEVEKMTKLMEGMSKETSKAAREAEALNNVKFIFNMAQNAPFDVKTLTDAFVKLKSGGLDPTDGSMKALVDSVAKFGGTSETMHRASIAIQQMSGKGVISMEELRQQLGEAVPNAINMMAQGAGMSMPKFTKLVQTGTVEATTALRNMFLVMRFENDGAAEAMMDSWTGMLALLNTKFELFKLEAGKNDFFKEAKEQLQDMIAMFDTGSAKRFANDLGTGLADIVRLLRSIVDIVIEWAGAIELAGKAFIGYFAVTRVLSLTGAIKGAINGQIEKYREDVQAKRDALANKQTLIANEIAEEQRSFAARQAMLNKQVASEQQAEQKLAAEQVKQAERQRAALAKELAGRVAHYQSLNALQQKFLGQQMAAELAAESAMRQKKTGSGATARGLNTEAERIGTNAAVNAGNIAAVQAEIAAIKARDAALLQSIQTTRNATTANNRQAESAALAAQHARMMASLLGQQATAATNAATGVGILSRAMSGAGVLFNAFGGWVGIAIGVLVTLGQKLWEYMNRWKEFQEVVKRTEAGVASKDDLAKATDRANEAAKAIKTLKTVLNDLDKDGDTSARSISRALGAGFRDSRGGADVAAYRASLEKQLAERNAVYEQATKQSAEQTRLLDEETVGRSVSQFERTYRRATEGKVDALRSEAAELSKAERTELDKARSAAAASGKKLTESEEDAISKRYTAKKNALVIARERYLLDYARERQLEVAGILKTETDPSKRKALEGQLKFINDKIEETSSAIKQAEQSLGRVPTTRKDDKPNLKEDPILREAERAKAAAAEALIAYKQALIGSKEIGDIKNQIAVGVLGDIAEGKFDTKEMDAEGKEKVPVRFGNIDKRKGFVAEFMKEVVNGKKSVDDFIAGLKLTETQSKQVLDIINNLTTEQRYKDANKAQETSNNLLADSLRDLDAAREETATNGISKESKALNSVIAKYDELLKKLDKTSDEYQRIEAQRNKAVANATETRNLRSMFEMREENKKFVEDTVKGVERSKIARMRSTMDYKQVAVATYQEELREFTLNEDAKLWALEDRFQAGHISFAAYQSELNHLEDAGSQYRSEAWLRYMQNAKSALDKLADSWRNSVDAMNQASANWAQQTMDYITKAMNGEKVGKFKDLVIGALKDVNTILIRNVLGDAVTSVTGGFANMMSGMLGLGSAGASGKADGSANAPYHVINATSGKLKNPEEEMFTAVKEKLSSVWDSVKENFSTVWDTLKGSMGGLFDSLKGGLSGMLDGIMGLFGGGGGGGGGMGDLLKLGMSLFGFAKGGVMSAMGSMPLNKYAKGGIATSPQLALFGEGSMNEAYVPLPDGRSIPVTMTGSNNTTTNQGGVVINIVVNKDGSETSSGQGDDAETWKRVASKVRGVVMEEMVTQQRPGGLLYR